MGKHLFSLGFLCLVVILSLGNSDGRATKAGQGNTGAPGDETIGANPRTCISCHGQTSIQTSLDITMKDSLTGELVDVYVPGQTYIVETTVNVSSGNPQAYGFQIVSLRDSDNQGLDTWSNPSSNAKIQFASKTQRTYVEHKGVSTSNTFSSHWTAPEQGSGQLTFYACGNGVDLSGDTDGDGASLATLTIEESTASSTDEENLTWVTAFPNPSSNRLNLAGTDGTDIISIYNLQGKKIYTTAGQSGSTVIDVNSWTPSLYQIQILKKNPVMNQQISFVKL